MRTVSLVLLVLVIVGCQTPPATDNVNAFSGVYCPGAATPPYTLTVSGDLVGTLRLEQTIDGATWHAVGVYRPPPDSGTPCLAEVYYTGFGSQGVYGFDLEGAKRVRVNQTSYTSGAAQVMVCRTRDDGASCFGPAALPLNANVGIAFDVPGN